MGLVKKSGGKISRLSPLQFSHLRLLAILICPLLLVGRPQPAHAGAGGIEGDVCRDTCFSLCPFGGSIAGTGFVQGPAMATPRALFAATALQADAAIPPNIQPVLSTITGQPGCNALLGAYRFGLVSGGINDTSGDVTNTAEFFGPVFSMDSTLAFGYTFFFSPTGSMGTPRALHQATLFVSTFNHSAGLSIGGKALITGGSSSLAGRNHSITALSSAEIFDFTLEYSGEAEQAKVGQFTFTAHPMNTARTLHQATLLQNGKILITGGLNDKREALNNAEVYDPNSDTFTLTKGKMNHARFGHTATLLNDGTVLIAGGTSNGEVYPYFKGPARAIASAEIYNPKTDTFVEVGNMHVARVGHTASRIAQTSYVLIAGGISGGKVTDTAELYIPGRGFSIVGNMNTARFLHSAASLETGQVLIAGGSNDPNLQTSLGTRELFDGVNAFVKADPMTDPVMSATRRGFAAGTDIPIEFSDIVVLPGGLDSTGTPQSSSDIYLPAP